MDINGHTPLCEDYVNFETAKLLKEKGFDEGCSFVVNTISKGVMPVSWPTTNSDIEDEEACLIALPTIQMAMKWLREVHKKWITITFHWHIVDGETTLYYSPYIMLSEYKNVVLEDKNPFKMKLFTSYEEACEAAIKYCLENLI